jgi:hypothetical protein
MNSFFHSLKSDILFPYVARNILSQTVPYFADDQHTTIFLNGKFSANLNK